MEHVIINGVAYPYVRQQRKGVVQCWAKVNGRWVRAEKYLKASARNES